MTEQASLDGFRGKQVLITGGLGFLGSNLAIALVGLGARVTLLDAMVDTTAGTWSTSSPSRIASRSTSATSGTRAV